MWIYVYVCYVKLMLLNSALIYFLFLGITGLAHPSTLEIGTTHGVYLLEENNSTSSCDEIIRTCSKFLHKPSVGVMLQAGACIDESKTTVLTDSAFFMSPPICRKLINFYNNVRPLTCEIDAYGDFLQVCVLRS